MAPKPDDHPVSHEQIHERIASAERAIIRSEERIMAMIRWLGGGFAAVSFAAITWGAGERQDQLRSNATAAENYGVARAKQDEITKRLTDISDLIRSESHLTREIISSHAADRDAHTK